MLTTLRDKRKISRLPARRTATVSFGAARPPAACVIWDISEADARLAMARPRADLPRHFALNLYDDDGVQWNCELVWTDSRFIGVKFIGRVP
jgi:hypothetical protein